MKTDTQISLRPVDDNDGEFLLRIYAASRETELSLMGPDPAIKHIFVEHQLGAQTRHYQAKYPEAKHDLIFCDGEAAGRLYVDRSPQQIAILDLTVLPQYRKRGIATKLVTGLQDEARTTARSLRIYLEYFNPAQKLFRELGFAPVSEENGNFRFEWRP